MIYESTSNAWLAAQQQAALELIEPTDSFELHQATEQCAAHNINMAAAYEGADLDRLQELGRQDSGLRQTIQGLRSAGGLTQEDSTRIARAQDQIGRAVEAINADGSPGDNLAAAGAALDAADALLSGADGKPMAIPVNSESLATLKAAVAVGTVYAVGEVALTTTATGTATGTSIGAVILEKLGEAAAGLPLFLSGGGAMPTFMLTTSTSEIDPKVWR